MQGKKPRFFGTDPDWRHLLARTGQHTISRFDVNPDTGKLVRKVRSSRPAARVHRVKTRSSSRRRAWRLRSERTAKARLNALRAAAVFVIALAAWHYRQSAFALHELRKRVRGLGDASTLCMYSCSASKCAPVPAPSATEQERLDAMTAPRWFAATYWRYQSSCPQPFARNQC